ncbi:hypothetical protein Tco_0671877 [Tanacetum coccineum]
MVMAPVLSQYISIERSLLGTTPSLEMNLRIQIAYIAASEAAMYSACVKDIAVVLCLELFQSTAPSGFQPERLAQGLEVGSIRRIQWVGYGVLEFLGVGTTFDIFQNIHILYLQYGILTSSGYGVLTSSGMNTTAFLMDFQDFSKYQSLRRIKKRLPSPVLMGLSLTDECRLDYAMLLPLFKDA